MTSDKTENRLLLRLREYAEEFAREILTEYIGYLRFSPKVTSTPKEVNDAIWGTVKLRPLEILVLDSPLVQRLRFIRQLGVVHWIYPGATHARFEHTLGVLHQAQQLITAINEASSAGAGPVPIDNNKAGLVRLCALLHDVGHGVFSHVSEHALKKMPPLRVALARFADEQGLANPQLSEVMAYYMIGSPTFTDMLATALDRLGQPISFAPGAKQNAARVVELVQNAIVGRQIDEDVPLLHELITGPFDADKLDYYVRDARLCGIPSILDISRLTQKITVRRVAARDLPANIAQNLSNKLDAHYIFGLKWSGAAILDELHLARVLLYAKIYRHKKVLAVESMVDALFEAMATAEDAELSALVELCFEFSDDQLLWSSPTALLSAANIFKVPDELKKFVGDILKRLRNRSLFVLALAVRSTYPSDPWAGERSQVRGLNDLVGDLANAQKLAGFRYRLVAEVQDLLTAEPTAVGAFDPALVKFSIAISTKSPLGGGTEIDRAFIFQGDKPVAYRDLDGVNHPAWANAYDFASPAAVIFCPRELASVVFVASERLIRRNYGVVLPPSALDLSKQDEEDVIRLKRVLEEKGWYVGVPLDIRPVPSRLTKQDVSVRIDALASKFEAFDEPIALRGNRRPSATRDRITNWLAQFREDELINCAIVALERIRFLGREDTQEALAAFVEAHSEFRGATICPLGELKDSGAVQSYLSRDLERIFPHTATVEEATVREYDAPVVFLDDFTSSGSQALDILGHWFTEDALKQEALGESRFPFGERERAYLRSRRVGFVFVAGWKEGLERIRAAIDKLGLDATVYAHIADADIPFAFEGALGALDSRQVDKFKSACERIGKDLLKSSGKSEDKQERRALGYGNRAMLLGSRLNIPTQTLSCIWMDGQVEGVDWHALLRRREKH